MWVTAATVTMKVLTNSENYAFGFCHIPLQHWCCCSCWWWCWFTCLWMCFMYVCVCVCVCVNAWMSKHTPAAGSVSLAQPEVHRIKLWANHDKLLMCILVCFEFVCFVFSLIIVVKVFIVAWVQRFFSCFVNVSNIVFFFFFCYFCLFLFIHWNCLVNVLADLWSFIFLTCGGWWKSPCFTHNL